MNISKLRPSLAIENCSDVVSLIVLESLMFNSKFINDTIHTFKQNKTKNNNTHSRWMSLMYPASYLVWTRSLIPSSMASFCFKVKFFNSVRNLFILVVASYGLSLSRWYLKKKVLIILTTSTHIWATHLLAISENKVGVKGNAVLYSLR